MTTVRFFDPAKVNLALHVTGQRADGYHQLDTLVAFADVGDKLVFEGLSPTTITPAPTALTVHGPEAAGVPVDSSNLVCRAVDALANDVAAQITLEKRLPVASGIGGGSADAAAAIRAVASARDMLQDDPALVSVAQQMGADVPMCLASTTLRAQGMGDQIDPIILPPLPAVLINPRVPVRTPEVFAALEIKNNSPLSWPPDTQSQDRFLAWLGMARNNLEEPALRIAPEISVVLKALSEQAGVGLARMSGSGATCFGLFNDQGLAEIAARNLQRDHPEWWVVDTVLGDAAGLAAPHIL
ncbi:MAG: 4-(cytidine 5'-diphospho)-2-C-methyl-D-erythritol kinase [Boseongicola sp.]|nr:4-(cytidine 5'-diphospho)-2-C-methyl-D-erythritol kinase [Boseongicola sp.]